MKTLAAGTSARFVIGGAAMVLAVSLGCGGSARKVLDEDRVERLKRDINKVQFAVRTTKGLMSRARGAEYLPDLYLRLAELFVEQAKYHYHITYERAKDKASGVVSVQTRLLKNQAIATYARLLALYPKYKDADKVRFFMAHEYRELGDYENMLKTYLELSDLHPKSEYRLEGLLVVGDYYFDKSDLTQAEKYYRMVIDSPESRVHAMAQYKLAWCKINQADFKGALKLFENSVDVARKWLGVASGKGRDDSAGHGKIDLRREALVDAVYPFTEVFKHKGSLEYFRDRADSKTTFLAALEKLGNRYYIKQNWQATAMVYRELLSMTGDMEDSLEWAHRLYEAVTNGKLYDQGEKDVLAIVGVIRRRYYNRTLTDDERGKLIDTFEKYARDMATRLHDLATKQKSDELFFAATAAYEEYLTFFGDSKNAVLVKANLAEALYASKQFLGAGKYYELVAKTQSGNEKQESIYTAVASYFEALKAQDNLTRLDIIQARAGLRRAGKDYIQLFPRDPKTAQVKFNIARTYYDAGELDDAIRLFTALAYQFPTAKEATVSAHLVLDAYRTLEDFEGLIEAGKSFGALSSLGDGEFKKEVAEIIKGAENRLLDSATLDAADEDSGTVGSEKLEQIATKFKGTDLECKALTNAFITARSTADADRVLEVGEKLVRACPTYDKLPDVLATMGKTSINAFMFARGAAYLAAAARRKGGNEAPDMYKAACTIHAGLGEVARAEESLSTFMREGKSAEEKGQLAVQVARLHVQAGKWDAMVTLLDRATAGGATSAQMMYLLGYAYFRKADYARAQGYLAQAVSSGRAGSDDDREAAAAAQFYLGEISFKTFEAIQLSSDLSQLGPALQRKLTAMKETSAAYMAVVSLGSAIWSVASLGRLSSVDSTAAESLRSLAMPQGLPAEAVQQVRAALEQNAAPLSAEAQDALKQCAATARKLKVLSEAAKACLSGRAPQGDPQTSVAVPTINREQPREADTLGRKLAKDPQDLPTIVKLGKVYIRQGNPYMARMVLGKGSEVKETSEILNLLGVATTALGETQAALELFEKAIKKDVDNKYAHANRASLLAEYGYTKESQAAAKGLRGAGRPESDDPRLIKGAARLFGGES